METPTLLSVAQACRALGVSRAFLYATWQRGDGPARIKLGKRTLIRVDALDAWLKVHERHGSGGDDLGSGQ
ncbi:MAG TPA: helix-turn-helix domain-containing protein [Stellaceae bacterium]|nr:helix-turn-helix domain-containing protein [Stellaceae bacterium]